MSSLDRSHPDGPRPAGPPGNDLHGGRIHRDDLQGDGLHGDSLQGDGRRDERPRPDVLAAAPLDRDFFDRPSVDVAVDLLGCVLSHDTADGTVAVRLTEVEAYAGPADPASHAYRGRTRRNAVMFGPPGHAYVYFTYGMHFCVNLVCREEGTAEAVLLRAGEVVAGVPLARTRRPRASDRDLARGPARLCQALAIGREQNGADVCRPDSPLRIRPGPATRSGDLADLIRSGPRTGVIGAKDLPWRFWIDGDPTVSPYRRHAPRRRRGTTTGEGTNSLP